MPAGGWLGHIIPWVADRLGLCDVFTLAFVFVGAWVALRVSPPPTSMGLGCAFDITIPLQHHRTSEGYVIPIMTPVNPKQYSKHQDHLRGYWPLLFFSTILELLCFYLVHPDLITMVVCIKTAFMTFLWLGRKSNGAWVTARKYISERSYEPYKQTQIAQSPNDTGNLAGKQSSNKRNKRREKEVAESGGSAKAGDKSSEIGTPSSDSGRSDPPATISDSADKSRVAKKRTSKDSTTTDEKQTPRGSHSSTPPVGEQGGGSPATQEEPTTRYGPPGLGPPSLPDSAWLTIISRRSWTDASTSKSFTAGLI